MPDWYVVIPASYDFRRVGSGDEVRKPGEIWRYVVRTVPPNQREEPSPPRWVADIVWNANEKLKQGK